MALESGLETKHFTDSGSPWMLYSVLHLLFRGLDDCGTYGYYYCVLGTTSDSAVLLALSCPKVYDGGQVSRFWSLHHQQHSDRPSKISNPSSKLLSLAWLHLARSQRFLSRYGYISDRISVNISFITSHCVYEIRLESQKRNNVVWDKS